jgi:hypothetical protein
MPPGSRCKVIEHIKQSLLLVEETASLSCLVGRIVAEVQAKVRLVEEREQSAEPSNMTAAEVAP